MTGLMNWAGVEAALRHLAPALANHLWQSTAFAAIAAGLTLALKKNHAQARYWIWMAASAKLLLPFALLAGIASHFVKPRAAAAPANVPMYVEVENFSEPFGGAVRPASVKTNWARHAVTPASATEATRDGSTTTPQSRPFEKLRVESGAPGFVARVTPMIPLIGGVVWLAGFIAVLVVWGKRWLRVARTMSAASPLCEGREVAALRCAEGGVGLRSPIELRASAGAMEPGVFGILRPVLAWPAGISARLDDKHLEAVMAHEVCHVRRRDNLTAAIHMFVQAVFWFHPMVWWMGARLVEERERACDEEVLAFCAQPQVYAESILKVCEFCVQSPLECVAGVTGADLKKRVVEIMTERVAHKLTLGKKILLAASALLVAAVPIVLGQAQAAHRLMLAAVDATPKPFLTAAHAMLALEERPFTGEIAALNPDDLSAIQAQGAAGNDSDEEIGPEFEVATIRPANRDDGRHWFGARLDASGRFTASAESLSALIWIAYIHAPGKGRVSGGPKWAQTDSFDINAKVDGAYMVGWDKLTDAQRMDRVRPTIRRLLADRFNLKLRIETQPTPVYALVQAKGGAHMKEVPAPDPVEGDPMEAVIRQMKENPGKPVSGQILCSGNSCTGVAVPMSNAIGQISGSSRADRIVIDETGLKGYYNFTFTQPRPNDDSAMAEVEDDLGLKFEPRTVPLKTYIIDSAEKPSVDGASIDTQNARLVLVAQEPGAGQPAPPPQVFHFPQAQLNSRGKNNNGPGIIDLPQPGYAAEITLAIHGTTDWLQSVQVISRSVQNIVSVRIGWAYVLSNGTLEFHQSEDQKVQGGAGTNNNFQLGSQNAAVRTDVKDFIAFVEQVTLKDGTVVNADHDKIAATYKDISEGKTVARSKAVADPNSTAAQQAGKGPHVTEGLKPIAFDVVSFRRTQQQGNGKVDLPVEGDFIAYHGVPIEKLILFAHIARKGYVSISGEPEWAKTDLYEFTAKVAPEDVAEWKQMTLTDKRAMMATLLADALKLKVHQDTEPKPVFDLIVGKDGPKLTEYHPGDTVTAPGGRVLTGKVLAWFDPFTLVCQDTTMAELVNSLSGPNRAGRVVIDKTGLDGAYNFTVPIPYGPLPQQIMDMSDAPSFYDGLKNLGLQMVKSTGVTDTIVVDHVERPAEN